MKRILLTGMSGSGKSTVTAELAARGFKAIDADCDEYSQWIEIGDDADTPGEPVEATRDWVWREERIQELLSTEDAEILFVSGCAANMGQFLPQFDHVILLSAPTDLIVKRLADRTTNAYGKHPDEVARVVGLIETVEPHLRRIAGHEIETTATLADVVTRIVRLARR